MAVRVEKPPTEKTHPLLTARKLDSGSLGTRGVGLDRARRGRMIAEAAYYRAEHRAFAPGHELEDWFAAEAEIDAWLSQGAR